MAEAISVKAIMSAVDTNFSSTMKACGGYADNLKKTLTSGLGFGAMAAIGSKAVSVVGSGLKTLTADSVSAGMNFESAMSSVGAISGATGKDLNDLTAKAKEMGATTQFSATESANAMEYMAMAGWKTKDMISGIGGIMDLAAASGSDLARTSDIVTDALTAFGKSAKDSGTFADVMAAASSNANTNVEMMGETFKYVGAAAGAMKYSIQDIALATGLMANSGIKGSEAGTALRSVITRMAKPTKESSAAMKKLGMSMTDSKGNMKSFGAVMKDLRKGMKGMTEDQKASYAAMLGGQEAMSGVLAIANASEEDFNKLSKAIENSTGAANEMANVKLDNLQGDVTLLKSGMEGLGITIYDQVGGKLRGLVGIATSVVGELNNKLSSGKWIEGTIDKIEKVAGKAEPYWNTLKINAIEASTALGEAFGAVTTDLRELTGEFGSLDSIRSFANVVGVAKDGIVTFSGFLKEHSATVAKLITMLPKLVIAYKGFKVVSAVIPGMTMFAKALFGLAGKGIGAIAGKLFGVAAGEKAVGTAGSETSGKIIESAAAFVALGAGVLMISAGLSIMAMSAVQVSKAGPAAAAVLLGMTVAVGGLMLVAKNIGPSLTAGAAGFVAFGAAVLLTGTGIAVLSLAATNLANAGPLAIACMVGMVAAIAGLAVGAAALGPALTAGAVGFIAFGAAIVLVAMGALIASAALAIVAGVLPTVAQYGSQGAVAIAQLGAGLLAFGAGAAVAGAGAVVLGAGLAVVAVGLAGVGVAVLVAAAGVLVLAAGAAVLGAGLTVAGTGLMLMGAAFPAVASGALASAAGLAALLGAGTAASAVFVVLAGSSGAAAVTVGIFAAAMITGAAGTGVMVIALKAVNSSMKSIAKNAKTTEKSLTSMRSSINVVNSGLDALGNKAKSAVKALVSQFSNAESKAKTSGKAVGNNFNSGVQSGMSKAVFTANSMTLLAVSAMRSAGSGSYSCGVYIGSGLANGMASQVGRVRAVAAQLAAAAEAAIRAKAQIHSPSRLTDKLGGYFGMGWVNGISGQVKQARKAAMELIQIPELSAVSDIGMNLSTKVSDLDDNYSYTRNETYTIHVPVEVDGRQVAKATATYTKEEIAKQEKRELRKQGRR